MRGFFLVFALISLTLFEACNSSHPLPAVPLQLHLKTSYKSLQPGSYSLLFTLPTAENPEFLLTSAENSTEVLVFPEGSFSEDLDLEHRSFLHHIQGFSTEGVEIEGKLFTSYAYVCEPKKAGSARRDCRDGTEYYFRGELKRNAEIIGTLEGDLKI